MFKLEIGCLYRVRLPTSKTFAVQVQALAMVVLLYPGGSGLNAHTITPSLFFSAALCAGSVGAMLQSFATQVLTLGLLRLYIPGVSEYGNNRVNI